MNEEPIPPPHDATTNPTRTGLRFVHLVLVMMLFSGSYIALLVNGFTSDDLRSMLGIGDHANRYTAEQGRCSLDLEHARDLPGLLEAGRISELDERMRELHAATRKDIRCERYLAWGTWNLARHVAFAGPARESLMHNLDLWVELQPNSWIPASVRGLAWAQIGYAARGKKLTRDTPEESFGEMRAAFEIARRDLERANEIEPRAVTPYIGLMWVIRGAKGDKQEAVALLDRALDRGLHSFYIFDAYMDAVNPRWGGDMMLIDHGITMARPHFSENPRLRVLIGEPLEIRADQSWREKKYAKSIELWTRSLEFAEDAERHYRRGWVYKNSNEHVMAIKDFDKAIEIDPSHYGAFLRRGKSRMAIQRFAEAVEDFSRAVEIRPWEMDALNDRAWGLYALDRYEDAVADLREAAALSDEPKAWTLRRTGEILLYDLGRPAEAVAPFARLVALHPEDAMGWYRYGVTLHELDNPDALATLEHYLSIVDTGDQKFAMYVDEARRILRLRASEKPEPGSVARLGSLSR